MIAGFLPIRAHPRACLATADEDGCVPVAFDHRTRQPTGIIAVDSM
jgi:hypothetical protein